MLTVLRTGKVTLPTKLERGLIGEMALAALDEFKVEVDDELDKDAGGEVAPFILAIEGSR